MISKLDAAKRQLETAVRLYFSEADPVAIHALTAAAHQLLSDLKESRGGTPMLMESILETVRPDKRDEANRRLRAAANFFKHADQDPGHVLVFDSGQTEIMLFDACFNYKSLTGEWVPLLSVYYAWFWLGPGADFIDVSQMKWIDRFRAMFPAETRISFFQKALPMASTFQP